MEATIKIDEKKTFQALVQFLRSLNIDVNTKIIKKEKRHRKEAEVNKLRKSKSKKKEKPQTRQMRNLYKLLDSVKKNELFEEIEDPVEWQKNLRNEWK